MDVLLTTQYPWRPGDRPPAAPWGPRPLLPQPGPDTIGPHISTPCCQLRGDEWRLESFLYCHEDCYICRHSVKPQSISQSINQPIKQSCVQGFGEYWRHCCCTDKQTKTFPQKSRMVQMIIILYRYKCIRFKFNYLNKIRAGSTF